MSYDLAVWAPVSPFTELTADEAYELLCERLEDDEALAEPTARVIVEFTGSLLAKWPALGEPGDERSPWAVGPEIGDAFGPCIYINMTYSGANEAVPFIASVAKQLNLVCYDPQVERVL